MKQIIQTDRDNHKEVINSIRYEWIRNILLQCGLDKEEYIDCFPENESDLTMPLKSKRRNILQINKIHIEEIDETVKIYIDNEQIAFWDKPYYKLETDYNQIDRKKRLYYSVEINHSSCFDEE